MRQRFDYVQWRFKIRPKRSDIGLRFSRAGPREMMSIGGVAVRHERKFGMRNLICIAARFILMARFGLRFDSLRPLVARRIFRIRSVGRTLNITAVAM